MSLLKSLKLPAPKVAPATPDPALAAAAQAWRDARTEAATRLELLKAAVTAACSEEPDTLRGGLEAGLAKLDAALDTVDLRLADALQAADTKTARSLIGPIAATVNNDAMLAHADANPFGVKTGLKALLGTALAQASKAVG